MGTPSVRPIRSEEPLVPEFLLQQTSPYGTRRASLLRGEGDAYLYVEALLNPETVTTSAVWVANHLPAPTGREDSRTPGVPPRMGAGGTRHPEGCPPFGNRLELLWFEEGDAVALVDGEGVLAAVPGWGGRNDFYGYSRYARGRCPLAWELTRDAGTALDLKVTESCEFWKWRQGTAWPEIRLEGLTHLERCVGPEEAAWPLGEAQFPELIATRHHVGETGGSWIQ